MSKQRMIIIPADWDQPITLESREKGLDGLQAIVGGYIEALRSGEDWAGYCNEEGKLQGLPVNDRATDLMARIGGHNKADLIAGNVVLTGFDEATGESLDIPQSIVEKINRVVDKTAPVFREGVDYLPGNRVTGAMRTEVPAGPRGGYGPKVPTSLMIQIAGNARWYRVYVMQYGNSGSAYVHVGGDDRFIGTGAEAEIARLEAAATATVDPECVCGGCVLDRAEAAEKAGA